MKITRLTAAIALLAVFACGAANAEFRRADIRVMTQNQYLGADLTPIIVAETEEAVNAAIINALIEVDNNNFEERVLKLTEKIRRRVPHLVALQEVYAFNCLDPYGTGHCALFAGAFNDHLAATVATLDGNYYVAAAVQNLTLPPEGFPLPGIPLVLDPALPPVFIQVIDRDVILARADVATTEVDFGCMRESPLGGCNFNAVAPVDVAGIPINIERGYVGVDATINGDDYRFINTHLEVKQLGDDPDSLFLQPAQATELWAAILGTFDPTKRLIVAGDFNSSPVDVLPFGVPTAYQQFTNGVLINGVPTGFGLTDAWSLKRFDLPGFTCCELADLSNVPSQHYERVDIVFAFPAPARARTALLNSRIWDKTPSGQWPSDHATLLAVFRY